MPKINLTPREYDGLPRAIRTLCAINGINQSQLADRVKIDRATMSKLLNRKTDTFRLGDLCRIAAVFRVPVWQLLKMGAENAALAENCMNFDEVKRA